MLKLEMTIEQAQVFMDILDTYLKKTGLNGAQNALFFQQKLENALREARQKEDKEKPADAI